MLVYVISNNGQPLMPTTRYGKIRRLLKNKQAKVLKRCPFTVQLLYETKNSTQPISLGVDAGSKYIGLSATTNDKVLFESVVEVRNDIVNLLSTRRELRSSRRNRKTRYRQARFDNRVKSKKKGWLAPSVNQKIQTHLTVVDKVCHILPITNITVEVASFDVQKIKNPDIQGEEYQQGEQLGFWNVREYVLWRDNHECQCCLGKSKDNVLNVHHIESRKTGGNAPNNLITICETCHDAYHKGEIKLNLKRGKSFRDATFMGIMRWALYNKLQATYPNVHLTYGYITKHTRIEYGLPKEHYIDARCISGNPQAEPLGYVFYQRKVRCHNRQIHKLTINRGGVRKKNQAPYIVKGFRLFDKVLFENKEYFIFGRRTSGFFDVRTLAGDKVNKGSISFKKLELVETKKYYLIERRSAVFLPWLKPRVSKQQIMDEQERFIK